MCVCLCVSFFCSGNCLHASICFTWTDYRSSDLLHSGSFVRLTFFFLYIFMFLIVPLIQFFKKIDIYQCEAIINRGYCTIIALKIIFCTHCIFTAIHLLQIPFDIRLSVLWFDEKRWHLLEYWTHWCNRHAHTYTNSPWTIQCYWVRFVGDSLIYHLHL